MIKADHEFLKIQELIRQAPASDPDSRKRYRGLSIVVVLASWNEEGKVKPCVDRIPKHIVDSVCVVDNGSSDGTAAEAEATGAIVIRHPRNLGAGGGYRSGYWYAKEKGFDLLIELAGDNQDDPEDIQHVVDMLIDGNYDYVHGSRWLKGGQRVNMTKSRTLLTWLYSWMFRLLFNARITDATNGFRVFKTSVLEHPAIRLWQRWLDGYELEPYLLIQVIRSGFRVAEAPVRKIYHAKMKENTKMAPFKGWYSILRPLFLIRFGIKS